MTFEKWEKEHSAEICPHCIKGVNITVTRCRLCVWQAAQQEKEFQMMSDPYTIASIEHSKEEGRREEREFSIEPKSALVAALLRKAKSESKLEGRLEAIAEKEKEDINWYMRGRKEFVKEALAKHNFYKAKVSEGKQLSDLVELLEKEAI